jgi:hypothetical protein
VTNLTSVADDGTLAGRQAIAAEVLALLNAERVVQPMREQGYQIGISCNEDSIAASATAVGSTRPTFTARVNVVEWWDAKELGQQEWARQLSHALAVALRAAERRTSTSVPDRARYGVGATYPDRLRLRLPAVPARGTRMAR